MKILCKNYCVFENKHFSFFLYFKCVMKILCKNSCVFENKHFSFEGNIRAPDHNFPLCEGHFFLFGHDEVHVLQESSLQGLHVPLADGSHEDGHAGVGVVNRTKARERCHHRNTHHTNSANTLKIKIFWWILILKFFFENSSKINIHQNVSRAFNILHYELFFVTFRVNCNSQLQLTLLSKIMYY